MTRRELTALLAAAPTAMAAEKFKAKVGLEIYSLRREVAKDLPGTLKLIRKMGFDEMEVSGFYGKTPAEFVELLKQNGLKVTAMVSRWEDLDAKLPAVVADAKALGAGYIIIAGIPRAGAFTAADAQRAAQHFDKWGAELARSSLRLSYHLHGFEFGKTADGTLADTLSKACPPKTVTFELDTFWVARGGEDPTKLLLRYPDRFPLVHLKDMAKGTPVGDLSGRAPDEVSVALGEGVLDLRGFLREAQRLGVKRYYIEDESPLAVEQIPRSLKFLANLNF